MMDTKGTKNDGREQQTWTSAFSTLLLTPTSTGRDPYFYHRNNPPRRARGRIWREVVLLSVHADLRKNAGIGLRRFVKLSVPGLDGLVLYQISMERLKLHFGHLQWNSSDPALVHHRETQEESREDQWLRVLKAELQQFLERGFDDTRDPGCFEEVIDAVNAVVIYLPTSACTSFVVSSSFCPCPFSELSP
ncbi:hypothetical protein BDN72DRAFT_65656 [Pluteus cervinus]|uniref:Uncharacterized protein n=1 Tax=Pluteus cervinus TaxID=181527 RepID=A0ACD2ZZR4_9AGAR|nr:hypothetical protein BDN72DRAFT_65656 [Pluteus cervinus]